MAIAGGFVAGMSLFALGVSSQETIVIVGQDAGVWNEAQGIFLEPQQFFLQNEAQDLIQDEAQESKCIEQSLKCGGDRMGTQGAGLNCTGAPRATCGA